MTARSARGYACRMSPSSSRSSTAASRRSSPRPSSSRSSSGRSATGAPLRVKYGIDPTGIDVHLGHTVPLRKLRQFQDLGHTAVIIIGNYTALVGDPSGRDETRATLTEEQVEANARDYLTQVGRIIDLDRAEVHHNGDWFSKWSFLDVLDLTRQMTLGQISAREDFAKRIAAEKPVYLHECLYPLMQGWDSVEIRADVELGGTEQLFSLLVARDLQQSQGQEPQVAHDDADPGRHRRRAADGQEPGQLHRRRPSRPTTSSARS